jgi:hypothetical protein
LAKFVAVRDIPLTDLRKYPGNARKGDLAKIRASIREHGQYRSLVVRDHDGFLTVLAGNNTFDGLTAEGYETARCEIITCGADEALRINVRDNRLSDLAVYDNALLLDQLADLDDLDDIGYTLDDVDELRRDTGALGRDATAFLDDIMPPLPPPTPSQPAPPPWATSPPPGLEPDDGHADDDPQDEDEEHPARGAEPPADGPDGTPAGERAPGPASAADEPPAAPEYVQVAWVVPPSARETIRRAVNLAQKRGDMATSAEGLLSIATHYLNTFE